MWYFGALNSYQVVVHSYFRVRVGASFFTLSGLGTLAHSQRNISYAQASKSQTLAIHEDETKFEIISRWFETLFFTISVLHTRYLRTLTMAHIEYTPTPKKHVPAKRVDESKADACCTEWVGTYFVATLPLRVAHWQEYHTYVRTSTTHVPVYDADCDTTK